MSTATTPGTPRFDVYRPIHKALRAFMTDTLVAIGRMDADDATDVAVVLEQTRALLAMLSIHLEDENRFVHPAMEARRPGSTARTAHDHVEHECALAELGQMIAAVSDSAAAERAAAALRLYRRFALFVAENLEHMNVEERENTAVLWAEYTDEELAALEASIVASVPPTAKAAAMRWMIPALNHAERVGLLQDMRRAAPVQAFEGVLAIARGNLSDRDWTKLAIALALPTAQAA